MHATMMRPKRARPCAASFGLFFAIVAAVFTLARRDAVAQAPLPKDGAPVCDTVSTQSDVAVASDGTGGAFLFWTDSRRSGTFAQRLTSAGEIAAGWPEFGLWVPCYPVNRVAAADDRGGAFVAGELPKIPFTLCHVTASAEVTPAPSSVADASDPRTGGRTPGTGSDAVMFLPDDGLPCVASDGNGGAYTSWTHTVVAAGSDFVGLGHVADAALTILPSHRRRRRFLSRVAGWPQWSLRATVRPARRARR